MPKVLLLTMLSAALLFAGCSKPAVVKEPPPATKEGAGASSTGVETKGTEQGSGVDARTAAEQALLAERIIYFDFDTADIRPEYRGMLAAHARQLAAKQSMKIRLEGNTDERGSREYNIGLGERRAQAVRRALMLQGAGEAQIITVSYGEERPAVEGDDEAAWAKNRRVEIVYVN